jgi:hypothetical protein
VRVVIPLCVERPLAGAQRRQIHDGGDFGGCIADELATK